LAELAADDGLRARIGATNRALAQAQYDENTMIRSYASTYGAAMGKSDFP